MRPLIPFNQLTRFPFQGGQSLREWKVLVQVLPECVELGLFLSPSCTCLGVRGLGRHRGAVEKAAASRKETPALCCWFEEHQFSLLTATRQHLDPRHIPSTGSSWEAEGARAGFGRLPGGRGGADQQQPGRCCPSYPEVPQTALQGQESWCMWEGSIEAPRGLANLGSLGTWVAMRSQLLLAADLFGKTFVSFLQPISPQNSWRGTFHTTLNC